MEEDIKVTIQDEKKIKKIKSLLSWLFAVIGLIIVLSQIFPLSRSYVLGKYEELKVQLMKDPFPQSYKQYVQNEFAYYDPGESYFKNLSNNAEKLRYQGIFTYDPTTKTSKPTVINKEYSENMYLNIESVEIKGVRITPNVESSDEKVYDQYLKYGLAHFKGTPLPGDGGNSFIYGHSAVQSFFNKHNNLPETIFTRLNEVDVGDTVIIKKNNEDIKYTVRNKKIVSSDDFSILQSQGDKETITMMTCWPLGVGTKRLIVVAEKY